MRKQLFLIFTAVLLLSCYGGQQAIENRANNAKISILFIGNSLTYTHDLPTLVKKSAKERGIVLTTKMIAYPNYAIADHWDEGEVQKLIASKKYDYVILQQGPSPQKAGKAMLMDYGKKYRELCKKHDATLSYFMVWPSINHYASFDAVIQNYTDAASVNNALLLPVGRVWKAYFDEKQKFDYYSLDQFHPSLLGSSIAAEVIVDSLFPESKTK